MTIGAARVALLSIGLAGFGLAGEILELLPDTPFEAQQMVREGVLDSAIFEQLLLLYDEPLSVPGGEVSQLTEFFPAARLVDFPDSADLVLFEPWNPTRIADFFHRYPHLSPYRPVLTFSSMDNSWGSLAVRGSLGAYTGSTTRGQIRLFPSRAFKAAGSFVAADTAIYLRSRGLGGVVGDAIRYGVGRLHPVYNDGLVLGRFTTKARRQITLPEQLLFERAGGFNGLLLGLQGRGAVKGEALVHAAPGSSALSLWTQVGLPRGVHIGCGMSLSDTVAIEALHESGTVNLHLGGGLKKQSLTVSSRVVVQPNGQTAALLTMQHKTKEARSEWQTAFVSKKFSAPLGQLVAEIDRELGSERLGTAALLTQWNVGLRLSPLLSWEPWFQVVVAGQSLQVRAGAAVALDGPVRGRCRYQFATRNQMHQWYFSLEQNSQSPWWLGGRVRINATPVRQSAFVAFDPGVRVSPWLSLHPSAAVSAVPGEPVNWRLQLEQRLAPFEKSRGILRIGIPAANAQTFTVDLYASLQFLY